MGSEQRLEPLGISSGGSRVCADKPLRSLIRLSKDLRIPSATGMCSLMTSVMTLLYVTA